MSQEIREQIAQEIEQLPCFCSSAKNDYESDGICWRCQSANIARKGIGARMEVVSHRDGCTYPETQNWCEFHTTQYWQGKL